MIEWRDAFARINRDDIGVKAEEVRVKIGHENA
jgi:hypothetical protein